MEDKRNETNIAIERSYILSDKVSLADAKERLATLLVEVGGLYSYIAELERAIINREIKIEQWY